MMVCIEDYEESLVCDIIRSIEKHGGLKYLSSVILTGSLGRDEATYGYTAAGDIILKSDVEMALIYRDAADKQAVSALIGTVAGEFEEELNLMAISEKRIRNAYNFNYSLMIPRYRTLFMFDLFNGSRTVWGRNWIGEKRIGLEKVDLYEAKRLVANRIAELVYRTDTACGTDRCGLRRQWKGKLMLAIASAYLILEGAYVSSYGGQYERLKKRRSAVDRTMGEGFFDQYEKAFIFLRKEGPECEAEDGKLREYVWFANQCFKKRSLRNPKVNCTARMAKYCAKYYQAGMPYGVFRFEDVILQTLIDGYYAGSPQLSATADVWHRVLY